MTCPRSPIALSQFLKGFIVLEMNSLSEQKKPGGGNHFGRPKRRWEDNILRWVLEKYDEKLWTGFPESSPNPPPCFRKVHSNIIFLSMPRSSKWPLLFRLSNQNMVCISHLIYPCCKPRPSHPPWFDHLNDFWWSIQVMNFLIIQTSSASCHFLPLRSKYSPQPPVLKHPQSMFFP